jgi:YesN/AraC family two-component response regulator
LEAANGNETLKVCKKYKGQIHLMVTDVVMPGMSGRELADRIQSLHPEMKVLYTSGHANDTIVHYGVLRDGVNYIQKPFTMEGLARKVREVLDK